MKTGKFGKIMNISQIKIALFMRDSFLGSILSTVDIIQDNTVETASTDGLNVYYNENFFNSISISSIFVTIYIIPTLI